MVHTDSSAHANSTTNDATGIPVASMVESIVGCKWSVGLLRLLADGCNRPSGILRASTGLSAKVLRFGIVRRTVLGEKAPFEVEYALTPFGRRFLVIIDEVRRLQEAVDSGTIAERAVERHGARHTS
jgi:DNA-binding HxlR family transcriptional regulator